MKTTLIIRNFAVLYLLLLSFTPTTVSALTRVVVINNSQCPANPVINPCYTSVADAVAASAASGDSIEIRPGTHSVADVLLNKSVSLYGIETAKTFLTGNSASTVLTVENVTVSMSIRKLTFTNATTGILVRNSTSIDITNNIFELGGSSTAIRVAGTSSPTISNNTFYANGTGISTDVLTLNIIGNIFFQNSGNTAITPVGVDLASIKYNLFYLGTIGPPVLTAKTVPVSSDPVFTNPLWQGNIETLDPLFVDATPSDTQRDFHLLSGTPCQDTGNEPDLDSVDGTRADIGAYGGPNSDTIPYPVSIVSSSATATTPATVNLQWSDNPAYTVKGYNIYYGYSPRARDGNDAIVSGGTATVGPRIDAGNATTIDLIVSGTSVTPVAPHLNSPLLPLAGSLKLTWTAVSGATGYNIYYSLVSAPSISILGKSVSGGSTTEETLSGLTDGVPYNVWVTALSQIKYYFSVTAYDTTTSAGTPGTAHESTYSSEKEVAVGDIKESGPSNIETGTPEPITPYPNLPNTGCFIASAAYGSASESAVLVLREFRDRYLVTNTAGRTFVRWYYANGPVAAGFLNDHPALKPLVRGLLAPAVAGAFVLNRAPIATLSALLLALVAAAVLIHRRRTGRSQEKTV